MQKKSFFRVVMVDLSVDVVFNLWTLFNTFLDVVLSHIVCFNMENLKKWASFVV